MAFVSGYALGALQERLESCLREGSTPSEQDLHILHNNWWVRLAFYLAPNNLVLRNLCLQALLTGNPEPYSEKIYRTFINLAYYHRHSEPLWAESYSYWGYSKCLLKMFIDKFQKISWISLFERIEENFAVSSYVYKDFLYAAPFGDLWSDSKVYLQDLNLMKTVCSVGHLTKQENNVYRFRAWPVGLNCHCLKSGKKIEIRDGIPVGFKFYEGYNRKYKNKLCELLDMFDIRRVISIFRYIF
jgi:hypothetical protein